MVTLIMVSPLDLRIREVHAHDFTVNQFVMVYHEVMRHLPKADKHVLHGAAGGTRTPNPLVRSQMLYPLSYDCKKKVNKS